MLSLLNNVTEFLDNGLIEIIIGICIFAVLIVLMVTRSKRNQKKRAMQKVEIDPEKVAECERRIKNLLRNEISLKIEGKAEYKAGGTRFGGIPDVPENFEWPYFKTSVFDDKEEKLRPLNFLAQFDLGELSPLDKDNLLPKTGLLSFFHVCDSFCWGEKIEDMKCVRVFWFEDLSSLKRAKVPAEFNESSIFPMLKITAESKNSFIDYEDFSEMFDVSYLDGFDNFDKACENLGYEMRDNSSKLLGWAELIQSNITEEFQFIGSGGCMVRREEYDGQRETEKASPMEWLLLFQLDTVAYEDFELMYGDCGRLYIYIRKEDLLARAFDKVFFSWQCG